MGNPNDKNWIARFVIQTAQAHCGQCGQYLTYFANATYSVSNDELAENELAEHIRIAHVESDDVLRAGSADTRASST